MGQQQLLLVILVTIIVGIATVVAINIFGTAAEQANRDAVSQDLLAAAAQAQAIYARPEMMNGAGGDFNNLDLEELLARLNIPGALGENADENRSQVNNENGVYYISISNGGDGVLITGEPESGGENITLDVHRDSDGVWQFDWNE